MMAFLFAAVLGAQGNPPVQWVRAGINADRPIWGIEGHLHFAVHPAGVGPIGEGGPRGLIRLGVPIRPNGEMELVNFIAIEPTIKGQSGRSFSELEPSKLDQKQGKRIWAAPDSAEPMEQLKLEPGTLKTIAPGVEELTVVLRVESFDTGARVRVVASQRSDRPDELSLRTYAEPDSKPLDRCILTATMGNKIRARELWLKEGPKSSLATWPNHSGNGFTDHATYRLSDLFIDKAGDVLAAITTNEKDPASVFPFPGSQAWHYGGRPVTQYWRKPKGDIGPGLELKVNGRFTYWASDQPIPGGVAYENFELVEPYREGSEFVFGITKLTPAQLGLP
ncbi:MAG TPA: hypothetical protein VGE01_09115 [Fimbriimonas sp.]